MVVLEITWASISHPEVSQALHAAATAGDPTVAEGCLPRSEVCLEVGLNSCFYKLGGPLNGFRAPLKEFRDDIGQAWSWSL